MQEQGGLLVKVTGLPFDELKKHRAVTCNSSVLVALSTEQSLKALMIMASPTSQHPRPHDLVNLGKAVGESAQALMGFELRRVRSRVPNTRLAHGTLAAESSSNTTRHSRWRN